MSKSFEANTLSVQMTVSPAAVVPDPESYNEGYEAGKLAGGSVTPEQIAQGIEEYLKNNPIETIQEITEEEANSLMDTGVYKIVCTKESGILSFTHYELLFVSFSAYANGIQMRIKSNGILYRNWFLDRASGAQGWESDWKEYGGSVDLSNYYTKTETEELVNSARTKKTILYEDVVNTPEWTNQPTYEGTLDAAFNTSDFYYVTLKDADGNALPDRQFKLKDTMAEGATVYSTVFTFSVSATGVLVENFPVEFTEIGANIKMRDAGVESIIFNSFLPKGIIKLDSVKGNIDIVVRGEVIPRNTNLYCYSHFKTDNNVESYHSTDGTTAFQSAATKDIVPYTTMQELSNKGNMLFDATVLNIDGNGSFSMDRKVVIRYSGKRAKAYQVCGFGNTVTAGTNIVSVAYRVNNKNAGVIRNGTKIVISEVIG